MSFWDSVCVSYGLECDLVDLEHLNFKFCTKRYSDFQFRCLESSNTKAQVKVRGDDGETYSIDLSF